MSKLIDQDQMLAALRDRITVMNPNAKNKPGTWGWDVSHQIQGIEIALSIIAALPAIPPNDEIAKNALTREAGERVQLRCFGGQVVDARVERKFLFMCLVTWRVRKSWDGSPPFFKYNKAAWRPIWRMW
jgi:hypothetical protein